jgi:choline monooxygenase
LQAYIDNYLDGGYHIPYNHKELAASVDIDTYTTTVRGPSDVLSCSMRRI